MTRAHIACPLPPPPPSLPPPPPAPRLLIAHPSVGLEPESRDRCAFAMGRRGKVRCGTAASASDDD
eukprot:4300437-Pyramimonas_sp.AAC.1